MISFVSAAFSRDHKAFKTSDEISPSELTRKTLLLDAILVKEKIHVQ